MGITHINHKGEAHMVDVGDKKRSRRDAWAEAYVLISQTAHAAVLQASAKKGDVLGTARLAGIMATKRTHELIPLCHPLRIVSVDVDAQLVEAGGVPHRFHQEGEGRAAVHIRSHVRAIDRTGVEMEALCAASVAALTVYDMLKSIDRSMIVTGLRLLRKTGGKSGDYAAPGLDE